MLIEMYVTSIEAVIEFKFDTQIKVFIKKELLVMLRIVNVDIQAVQTPYTRKKEKQQAIGNFLLCRAYN